ncbi:MAG: preprotein translocase subunit SecG [Candidatus Melainabacteria bacterium]|nr:preprotein translocase subunit SecG [Candidatus Melainabacteria bacterium]
MHVAYIVLLGTEVLLGLLLVSLILLHAPKAEGMGGIGGAASVFSGKRGAEAGLNRLTWIVASLFLLVCALLGFGIIRG